MRLSPCLVVIAALSSSVQAFYPYELKAKSPVSRSTWETVQRRFLPWTLSPTKSDTHADTKPTTLDIKKLPVRRGNNYDRIKADTPKFPQSAPLDQDGLDYSYFVAMEVGSQKQEMWLAVDTGSPSTWVFDAACTADVCTSHHTFSSSASSSFSSNGSSFSLGYSSGTVRGGLGKDTMSVAGLDVDLPFGQVTKATNDFSSYPIDGILGLGRSYTGGWKRSSFMDVVAEKKLLKSNLIGFSLSRASNDPKSGEVNFGKVDTSKFDGDISYTSTNADSWTIPLDDAYVNGQSCNFSKRSTTIDTGTTYIFLPPADAKTLFSFIPGSSMSEDENYVVPCNSTAALEFSFSGIKYSILPEDYIGEKTDSGCLSTIVGHQSGATNTWLVGDVFLKNVYSVFDFDNAKIGFGKRAHSSSGNGTSEAPSRSSTTLTTSATGSGTSTSSDTAGQTTSATSSTTSAAASSAASASASDSSALRLAHGVGWPLLGAVLSALFV
ncbi:Aspartic-type endopeptidase ctsD [Penicillium alfredii]|uniref:Aspartic-type endopeptidase ctsD n=1 Tax=Penicillium alfredii TaxID=1506179 RepID=A0A9W9EH18_9EURO|nr:Aspartic-type endopeptidase ctsD [Penicillium alfredii]KAJ5081580.1 Aspartic-type endopeptidase ctsD [Penicillium alfredii]